MMNSEAYRAHLYNKMFKYSPKLQRMVARRIAHFYLRQEALKSNTQTLTDLHSQLRRQRQINVKPEQAQHITTAMASEMGASIHAKLEEDIASSQIQMKVTPLSKKSGRKDTEAGCLPIKMQRCILAGIGFLIGFVLFMTLINVL